MKSRIAWLASCAVLAFCSLVYFPRSRMPATEGVFGWDVGGYYWYLPAVFSFHDLKKQEFSDSILRWYQPVPDLSHAPALPNGNRVNKYSAGMALYYSPAFFTGHAIAKAAGYPADGFSRPYAWSVQVWGLVVAFLGLFALRRLLLRYYSDGVVACCLLLLVAGTNYLNYASVDAALSHNYLFTAYALLLLLTESLYRRPTALKSLGAGLLVGSMMLARPTEAIAALIPLLWGLNDFRRQAWQQRLHFIRTHFAKLLLAMAAAAAVFSIQLAYWKWTTGHWLYYSYGDQGFSWRHPHCWDYALSYRSGWLTYTPLLLLAFPGMLALLQRGSNRVAIFTLALLSFYIVSAWDIWWYGGTGGRAMIQYYPVWIFFFAALLTWAGGKALRTGLLALLCVAGIYVNGWMTWQQHRGGLYDSEGMSGAYYWRVIGRWNVPQATQALKDGPYLLEGPAKVLRLLYATGFEGDTAASEGPWPALAGARSLYMSTARQNSAEYKFPAAGLAEGQWVRASALFYCRQPEYTSWKMLQFYLAVYRGNALLEQPMVRVQRLLPAGSAVRIGVDYRIGRTPPDSLAVKFWYPVGGPEMQIDSVRVELLSPQH